MGKNLIDFLGNKYLARFIGVLGLMSITLVPYFSQEIQYNNLKNSINQVNECVDSSYTLKDSHLIKNNSIVSKDSLHNYFHFSL